MLKIKEQKLFAMELRNKRGRVEHEHEHAIAVFIFVKPYQSKIGENKS